MVAGVQIGIVRFSGLDHPPKDFQQALSQTAQGAGMAFAFRPFLSVIDLGPRANPPTALSPKMDRMAQDFVALVADDNPMNLA